MRFRAREKHLTQPPSYAAKACLQFVLYVSGWGVFYKKYLQAPRQQFLNKAFPDKNDPPRAPGEFHRYKVHYFAGFAKRTSNAKRQVPNISTNLNRHTFFSFPVRATK